MSLLKSGRLCVVCKNRQLINTSYNAVAGSSRYPIVASPAPSPVVLTKSKVVVREFSTTSTRAAARTVESQSNKKRKIDMNDFPPERIRNLSIIAHIDHGKSTLADRLLQMTDTVPATSSPQFLDKLKVERERGITVKAQTVSIMHTHTDGNQYLINLIDTPGHVDFSYEVSRSLGACEGGLLLVDCTQGIQAQTLSVFHVAQEANLTLLPVINKVDLPHASPADTSEQIESTLGLEKKTHMRISAKSGLGVEEVLGQIIEGLPSPRRWTEDDDKLRGLVFDTFYDHFRGVVSLVRLFSGSIKKGDKIKFLQSDRRYDVLEVGIHNPEEVPVDSLMNGQVGYVVCNMKNSEEAFIGDTICLADKLVEPLPGFKPMKAMVYAGIFPIDSGEFNKLEEAIERLTLNDRSVTVQRESSAALSQGFRLGFLGTLHMDVFRQRLEDEYDSNVIVTAPTVPYKVKYHGGREEFVSNPAEFPDVSDPKARVVGVEEPMVHATIFVPQDYIGQMMDLCARYRGTQQEYRVLDATDRAILRYAFPLSEIVTDFFSELKSASSGFASFDYEEAGYEESNLVKLNLMLNGKPVDALAMIVHKSVAQTVGRAWAKKLKDVLPRQLFEVAIQAAMGSRVVARETLSAVKKDVTAGLYGGHYERKLKHLNKQKEGKKRLKRLAGNIDIPQSAFFDVLSSRPRAFSTSTRILHSSTTSHSYLDSDTTPSRILKLLPDGLPPLNRPPSSIRAPPITPHTMPPAERSAKLSLFNSLLYSPTSTTDEIHAAFIDIYLASPYSHVFTSAELDETLRSMLKREEKNEMGKRQNLRVKVRSVLDEYKTVAGQSSKSSRRLELAFLSSLSDTGRQHKQNEYQEVIKAFDAAFPKTPDSKCDSQKQRYTHHLRRLLHLSALSGDNASFDLYLDRLDQVQLEPFQNAYACLAKLTLLDRTQRQSEILPSLLPMLDLIQDKREAMILVNFSVWSLAKTGDWKAVGSILQSIAHDFAIELPSVSEGIMLMGPRDKGLQLSTETMSILINTLSHQGHLRGALQTLQMMLQLDFRPGISDYVCLFKGFARYGNVSPRGRAGNLASAFPMWAKFEAHRSETTASEQVPSDENALRAKAPDSGTRTIGRIWQRTSFGLSRISRHESENRNSLSSSLWTFETLQEIFQTFLQVTPHRSESGTTFPNANGDRAPSPKAVWTILMAFARTTNGDENVIKDVWAELEKKFGHPAGEVDATSATDQDISTNPEGWRGWREDGRLRRLKEQIEGLGR